MSRRTSGSAIVGTFAIFAFSMLRGVCAQQGQFLVDVELLSELEKPSSAVRDPAAFWKDATVYQKKGVVLEADDAARNVITEGFWVLDQFTPGVVVAIAQEGQRWFADVEFGAGRNNWIGQRVRVDGGQFRKVEQIRVDRVGEQDPQLIEAEHVAEGLKLSPLEFGRVISESPAGPLVVRFPVNLLSLALPRLGARVVRSRDWASGYIDGGAVPVGIGHGVGNAMKLQGTVEKTFGNTRVVEVLWDATGRRGVHRFDHNGFYDLRVVREGPRPSDAEIVKIRKRLHQLGGAASRGYASVGSYAGSSMPAAAYGTSDFYGEGVALGLQDQQSPSLRYGNPSSLVSGASQQADDTTDVLAMQVRGRSSSQVGGMQVGEVSATETKPYVVDSRDVPPPPQSAWVNRQDSTKLQKELFGDGRATENDKVLFDGAVSLVLPPQCKRPEDKALKDIYVNQAPPAEVYADQRVNILVSATRTAVSESTGSVESLKDFLVSDCRLRYPTMDWHDRDVYLINGVKWVVLEFSLKSGGSGARRFIVASTIKGGAQYTVMIRLEGNYLWKWLEMSRWIVTSLRMT